MVTALITWDLSCSHMKAWKGLKIPSGEFAVDHSLLPPSKAYSSQSLTIKKIKNMLWNIIYSSFLFHWFSWTSLGKPRVFSATWFSSLFSSFPLHEQLLWLCAPPDPVLGLLPGVSVLPLKWCFDYKLITHLHKWRVIACEYQGFMVFVLVFFILETALCLLWCKLLVFFA